VQLDLFFDPPAPMNPNRNPIAPDCFRDYVQYSEWLGLARIAKEQCTICEDCGNGYKSKMMVEKRCHFEWHSIQFMPPKKPAVKKPAKIKVKKELEYEKLYWEFPTPRSDNGPDNQPSSCAVDQEGSATAHAQNP